MSAFNPVSNSTWFPVWGSVWGSKVSSLTMRIRALFATGQQGAWYEPRDVPTLFQDAAGTVLVAATGQPVGLMKDKSGRANHASQATANARPLLQIDAGGLHSLLMDGIDDNLGATAGGAGTAGFFFCAAIKPTGGAATNRTLWSDAGANTGYRVRINAANQLELAAGNGTPLTPPVAAAPTTSLTGGTLAAATYFYGITALDAKGESLKSNEVSVTTTGVMSSNTVTWGAVTGAASYRIYRGTATAAQNGYYSVGAVTSFVDTGAANTAGTPPTITDTAFTKLVTVATVAVGTANIVTAWDDGANLNVQIGNGAIASVARPAVAAGTAGFTLGKDNAVATSFFTGNIYPEVYRNGAGLTVLERDTAKRYVANLSGVIL